MPITGLLGGSNEITELKMLSRLRNHLNDFALAIINVISKYLSKYFTQNLSKVS